MSEHINNREYRKEVIKQIIKELHDGKSVEDVKQKFEEAFHGVSATEISEAEGALIAEGLPVEEVQRLCDVHAAVFKGSIAEIHQPVDQTEIPGHPTNILKRENRGIERIIEQKLQPNLDNIEKNLDAILEALNELSQIDIHYSKKENLLFPYMEKYGITAPPKVMWGVDDEIRADLKKLRLEVQASIDSNSSIKNQVDFKVQMDELIRKVNEMIFKEESILLPMVLETLTVDEWKRIADDSDEIGFMLKNIPTWNPTIETETENTADSKEEIIEDGLIQLSTGNFTPKELERMLNTLPFDLTYVDKNDKVRYFSQGPERIFARTKAVIGREVSNCHPPASVHIVEGIVDDFKSGKKDHEDFWINMGGKLVYIRYFAIRDEAGEYQGVLEVTQNIKSIQELTGEKRLVTDDNKE